MIKFEYQFPDEKFDMLKISDKPILIDEYAQLKKGNQHKLSLETNFNFESFKIDF